MVPALWSGIAGQYYEADVKSPKAPPLRVKLSSGHLPESLHLSETGKITGVPLEPGQYTFTVSAVTAQGKKSGRTFLLLVSEASNIYGPRPLTRSEGGKDLSGCHSAPLAGRVYRLTADVSAQNASSPCFYLGDRTRLDLNGFTVRGRLLIVGNPSGAEIWNGTVNCDWVDEGGDAGCINVVGEGEAREPLRVHDLTINNSAIQSRALHIDWPSQTLLSRPSIVVDHLRVKVSDQPQVSRAYAVSVIAKNQFVLGESNALTCSAAARACQAFMCYGVANCKLYHNRIVMEQNTTDENGRALLFDGHTQFGEAWNNEIVVNNNRAVRIRDSRNIRVHNNIFRAITPNQNALAAIHVGDPDGREPNDLQSSVDTNRFLSTGGNIVFARGATNIQFADNVVECSPRCAPGALAQIRGGVRSDLTFRRNKLIGVASPAIVLGLGAQVSLCESGQAAGEGTVVNGCPQTPVGQLSETNRR